MQCMNVPNGVELFNSAFVYKQVNARWNQMRLGWIALARCLFANAKISVTVQPTGNIAFAVLVNFSHCLAFVGPLIPLGRLPKMTDFIFIDPSQPDFDLWTGKILLCLRCHACLLNDKRGRLCDLMWDYWAGDYADLQVSWIHAHLCTGGIHLVSERNLSVSLTSREFAESDIAHLYEPIVRKKKK